MEFRKMRRFKQELDEVKCYEVLKNEKRATLAMNGEFGYPYAIPVNYIFDENCKKIYLHGAKSGLKIDLLKQDDKVCFTVHDDGYLVEGDWAYYVHCVVIKGRAKLLENADEQLRNIGYKYYPTKEEVDALMADEIQNVQVIEITIDHMSGKLVHEK